MKIKLSQQSCPAFENTQIQGNGCEKFASFPGLNVTIHCKTEGFVPVDRLTLLPQYYTLCNQLLIWSNSESVECVEPCKEGNISFEVGGSPRSIPRKPGYKAVDSAGISQTSVKCETIIDQEGSLSSQFSPVTYIPIEECSRGIAVCGANGELSLIHI